MMKELKTFMDTAGRLTAFPARRKKKLYSLIYLSEKFEAEREYSEKEVNGLLNQWHTFADPATLRRELYDYRFLDRSTDGRVYRLASNQPTRAELGLPESE